MRHAPWIRSDEEQEGSEVLRVHVDVGQEGQRQEDYEEEDAMKAPGLEARREAGGERCALRHDSKVFEYSLSMTHHRRNPTSLLKMRHYGFKGSSR